MNLSLGGPGLACSVNRVRRLAAGELTGEERMRAEEHVAGCLRCQASASELELERRELAESLPFREFASGVAERLARPAPRSQWRRSVTLALAACLVAAVAAPVILKIATPRPETQVKGGASVVLYAQEGAQVRALGPGEPVPAGARLRLSLLPAGRRHAAVALVDADGVALLYDGPALSGPLPEAFEWTGPKSGTLVVMLSDSTLEGKALTANLERGGARAPLPAEIEVIRIPLAREVR
jgi:hypothetical protein